MRKIYASALAVLFAGAISAQTPSPSPSHRAIKQHFARTASEHTLPLYGADRDVIWENDFSNAGDWVIDNIDDPNDDNWVIGTAVPSGAFAIDGIASTSAANGFALFDSDLLCGGTQNAYVQMANPVDLSAYPGAVLQFEQFYRAFQGACFVDVSANGTDWTEFPVNEDVAVNAATPNPELISLNISSVAANQATVWVRFRYTGGCDYAWMVDDVAIITLPENDLIMQSAFLSHTGGAEEYCRIPTGQLLPTMLVGGTFENFGSATQTNVTVNMEVRDGGGNLMFSASTTVAELLSGATADMSEEVTLPSLPDGQVYTATFTVSSDQSAGDATPADNEYKRSFAVQNDIFSLDGLGNHPAGYEATTAMGTASFEGGEDGFVMMTQYNITNSIMVYGIQFEVTSTSEAGAGVTVAIRDTADVLAAPPSMTNLLAESDIVSLTADDVAGGVVSLMFLSPIELAPGGYYAGVEMFSNGGENNVAIFDDLTVPQPALASMIFISGDDAYTNGNASVIRLITDPSIGIRERDELTGVTIFPNPSNGIFRVNTAVDGVYNVEVMNTLGELVHGSRINGSSAIDLSGVAKGVYQVRISNEKASTVQRITLN